MCSSMSRRVSTRQKRGPSSILQDYENQPPSHRRRVQSRVEQAHVPGPSVEELVEKVTNAVLEKLQVVELVS